MAYPDTFAPPVAIQMPRRTARSARSSRGPLVDSCAGPPSTPGWVRWGRRRWSSGSSKALASTAGHRRWRPHRHLSRDPLRMDGSKLAAGGRRHAPNGRPRRRRVAPGVPATRR